MRAAGMEDLETYISRRQNTVAQFITTMPFFYLCLEEERMFESQVYRRWWEKGGLYLVVLRQAW